MCPSAPVSPPADIGFHCSDEEVVMSLKSFLCGAPLPANVITEVDPYTVFPGDLPDGIWYFFNLENPKATDTGYWKAAGDACRINTNSSTIGSRITLEFYIGQAPHGRKTDWVMHDYRINQNGLLETDNAQDSHSLSKVFLNHSQISNPEEKQTHDANGMSIKLDIEKHHNSQNSTSQGINRDDKRRSLTISKRHVGDSRSDHPVQDLDEICDFSRGDFLELLDLDNPESFSSSSGNSSCLSISSDEYFDPSALLRDLEYGSDRDLERKYTESKFSVSSSLRPDQVVLRPESLGSNKCNLKSGENLNQESSLPPSVIKQNDKASKHDVNRNPSTLLPKEVASSSSGIHATALEPEAVESKAVVGGMRKHRKKYWCFMPF